MKTTITTWQRVSLLSLIGTIEGNFRMIHYADMWQTALEFTKADSDSIGLVQDEQSLHWTSAHDWDVELPDDPQALAVIQAKFKEAVWPARSAKDVKSLAELLKVSLDSPA